MNSISEEGAFFESATALNPTDQTRCEGWTVHDVVAHLAAGAAEIVRNVSAFNEGGPTAVPATRGFEEREAPYRAMAWSELLGKSEQHRAELNSVLDSALAHDPKAITPWTGRQMPIAAFVSHTRSEYALHRWDLVGDDAISAELLARPEHTMHAIRVLGIPLVAKGNSHGAGGTYVLRSEGTPDVVAAPAGLSVAESNDAEPDVTADPASRLLLLWGRQPAPSAHIADHTGRLGSLRALLAGY